MCLGMFMAILDIQVVVTSLPAIQRAIGISPDQASWVQTSYLIAEIIAIPLTGRLTHALTLRWLFVGAVALFTLASAGCAFSTGFASMIACRAVQGLAGGVLIPAVFSAVFLLFPTRLHPAATTLAGIMAVLAPTVGPVVGGWITETYSWRWLFLINIGPGVITTAAASCLLPRDKPRLRDLASLDAASVALLMLCLASLEIGLKQAPRDGWLSLHCSLLLLFSAATGAGFVIKTRSSPSPVVRLSTLRSPAFAVGCAVSFCFGVGLFGSVYLMPVFLAYVRHHNALEIGTIMLVTGGTQLVAAPIAGALSSRVDARLLSALGLAVFGVGLGVSSFDTAMADFREMVLPQVLRGAAIMFCLLPTTRLALEAMAPADVPDASALFNLMRNLGGAIGIAVIDTILYGRTVAHADALRGRLIAGDTTAARAVGLDLQLFTHRPEGVSDATVEAYVRPLVERAALTHSINEAWMLLAMVALVAALLPALVRGTVSNARYGGGCPEEPAGGTETVMAAAVLRLRSAEDGDLP
ncbi:MAG: DHA2 family efflux MFS transporter permease subunit [Xanthobacteraceae bacterium]|nr:DHA2 family efflux MFS transporter permease subunit [Xanthobacteraceae bacterium]